ncbi:hypothetical protein ACWGQ5_57250 [Streptomyces sp. NPDC055722]
MNELDARLAEATEHGPGAGLQFEPLVKRLRIPAAAFLQPDLERRLACHIDTDDSFARGRIAHVLAGACGAAALPALLRARESDRNDGGDTPGSTSSTCSPRGRKNRSVWFWAASAQMTPGHVWSAVGA